MRIKPVNAPKSRRTAPTVRRQPRQARAPRAPVQDAFERPQAGLAEQFGARFQKLAGQKKQFMALMVTAFGATFDRAAAEKLRQKTLAGDMGWLPKTRVLTAEEMNGGTAAYDAGSETIYLKAGLAPALALKAYAEEVGHHLDKQLNVRDTAGDEGDVFRRLLWGEKLSSAQLAELRREDDRGVVKVDGREVQVEFFFKKIKKAVKKAGRKIKKSVKKVAKGASRAVKSVVRAPSRLGRVGARFVGRLGTSAFTAIKRAGSGIVEAGKRLIKKAAYSKVVTGILTVASFVPGYGAVAAGINGALGAYRAAREKDGLGFIASVAASAAGFGAAARASNAASLSKAAGWAGAANAVQKKDAAGFLTGVGGGLQNTNLKHAGAAVKAVRDKDAGAALAVVGGVMNSENGDRLKVAGHAASAVRAADKKDAIGFIEAVGNGYQSNRSLERRVDEREREELETRAKAFLIADDEEDPTQDTPSSEHVGTEGNDRIRVRPGKDGGAILEINGQRRYLTKEEAVYLSIRAGGGDDLITVDPAYKRPVRIDGGAGNDEIHGGGGKDTLFGGEGNDRVYGKAGNDLVFGGGGQDYIEGGRDQDMIYGELGNDQVKGQGGNDTIYGGSGGDRLSGGEGRDRVYGNDGNDNIELGDGRDFANGGAGNDRIDGGAGSDVMLGLGGRDVMLGRGGSDYLDGGADDDVLDGGSGGDQLFGGRGNDRLVGGRGIDALAGGHGRDAFDSGTEADNVYYERGEQIANGQSDRRVNVEMGGRDPGSGIQIKDSGDPEFGATTRSTLDALRSVPEGRGLLERMDDNRHEVYLRRGMRNAAHLMGDNKKDAYMRNRNSVPGPGVSVTIESAPEYLGVPNQEPWEDTLNPAVIMHHELIHADDAMTGTLPKGTTDRERNLERIAVGLSIDHDGKSSTRRVQPNPYTENGLRRELNMPRRPRYLARRHIGQHD